MRGLFAVPALLLLACASGHGRFAERLPPELPDISRWEMSSGRAELRPGVTVEYELYVSPLRPAFYGVTRYRWSEATGRAASEKLQWDRDGRDVRRYECVREAEARCSWRQLAHGSGEYDAEMRWLVAVYFLHAEVLNRRERARLPAGAGAPGGEQ